MGKHRKSRMPDPKGSVYGAPDKHWPVKPDPAEFENRLANDEFFKGKKESSGAWVLLFLLGLLILLVVQHWLRQ